MKRILACALAVLMLVGMAACGGNPATTPTTEPGTAPATTPATIDPNDPLAKAGLPEMDFEGRIFSISDGDNLLEGSIESSPLYAAKATMWLDLADRYDCEFDVFAADHTIFETAGPIIMTGDSYADIVETKGWVSGYFMQAGYCTDMSQLDYLDFTKDYWVQSTVKEGNFNGQQLVVSGSYALAQNMAWGLFFNKTLAETLEIPDLYQLVRDGKWTWDKFDEYARKATFDSNGDNVMDENDTYGWGGPRGDVDYAWWIGVGGRIYDRNSDGDIVLSVGNSIYTERINGLKNTLNATTLTLSDWTQFPKVFFPEDRLLFCPYPPFGSYGFWSEMEDFGFIPMPKWNEQQESYYAYNDHHLPTTFIPTTAEDPNQSAFIMEAMACYSQAVVEQVWLEDYELTYLRDEDSFEMLTEYFMPGLAANPVVTYWGMAASNTALPLTMILNTVALGSDFAAAYEMHAETAQLEVDSLFGQSVADSSAQ